MEKGDQWFEYNTTCPNCKSTNYHTDEPFLETDGAGFIDRVCDNCDCKWREYWIWESGEILKEGENLEIKKKGKI